MRCHLTVVLWFCDLVPACSADLCNVAQLAHKIGLRASRLRRTNSAKVAVLGARGLLWHHVASGPPCVHTQHSADLLFRKREQ